MTFAALLAFAGCVKEVGFDASSSADVTTLLYPGDGYELELIGADFATLALAWEEAEKGSSLPSYSVIFYASDKVTEIGRFLSNGNGLKNMLTLPHPDIIEMAEIAGIEANCTGDIYWTVAAASGMNVQTELPAARRLVVTRDGAAVNAPKKLYLTGAGTEAGDNIEDALAMTSAGDGKFEIFASINGTFSLVNRAAEGGKRTFYVTGDGAITSVAENAASFEDGVYWINVDFSESKATLAKITDVKFFRAGGEEFGTMSYKGNGTWELADFTIPSDGDDRYRFTADMGGVTYVWGSNGRGAGVSESDQRDNDDPGTVDSGNSYFDVHFQSTRVDDSYGWVWKFHAPTKGIECAVRIHTNGGRYYHEFDFGFDVDNVPVVTNLIAPADNAEIKLRTVAGSQETFSWEKPEETPALKLTSYSLVFFKDAAGAEEVGSASFDAGYGTSKTLTHTELETIAEAAGIAASASGTIYWGVKTALMGSTAMSSVINSVRISRMAGVPESLYLTGAGTEYGTGFGKLKNTGAGQFEIFTRLSDGTYCFTDKTEGEARKFVIDGNDFKEADEAGSWSGGDGICRIKVDYMTGKVTIEKIGRVYMQVAAYKENQFTLDYSGKGIWEAENIVPDFTRDPSWGGDTRFFVKMVIDGKEWKLANQKDFGGNDPETAAPERSAEYAVTFWDDTSDWYYHYKVIKSYRGQNYKHLDFKLNCSPDEEFYYVHCNYLDN